MDNLNLGDIEQLFQSEPPERLLLKAIKALKVGKKNRKSRWILVVICCILGSVVGIHKRTATIFRENIDAILNVLLALFGVIFTGYSLPQAFMSKQMLFQLPKDTRVYDGGEKSRLQDVNENFVYLMLLYAIVIIVTLIIKIVMLRLPDSSVLFLNMIVDNVIAVSSIAVYFIFIGMILWRTASFVSTISQPSNIYAVTRVPETIDEEEKP